MFNNVTIRTPEAKNPDGSLACCEYKFYLLDNQMVLDSYAALTKESTRKRNWTVIEGFDRMVHRSSAGVKRVPHPEVPEAIWAEAVQQFRAQIVWRPDHG
jgi:hypothetical protein